jgi:hypothetical protein
MIKKLLFAAIVAICFTSCKKDSSVNPVVEIPITTSDIIVPAGFKWESSRNINVNVSIYDAKFQGIIHIVSIYSGNPEAEGVLITKGSATTIASFKSKLYLSNQIKEVYIVSTAPDNTKVTKVVKLDSSSIETSVGN